MSVFIVIRMLYFVKSVKVRDRKGVNVFFKCSLINMPDINPFYYCVKVL